MSGRAGFAYGQARIQAHYGRMPDDAIWGRLERIADFGQAVQVAKATALRPWLEHVGPESGPHAIELALRHRFRRHVEQVAGWFPRPWRPAVAWVAVSADLAVAAYLLAGRPPLPWMSVDPWYRDFVAKGDDQRHAAFRASRLAPLAEARPARIQADWLEHWRRLWPSVSTRARGVLEDIGCVFASSTSSPGEPRLLNGHFRRETQRPGAVFAYLAIALREMERLRGLLHQRRLLPSQASVT